MEEIYFNLQLFAEEKTEEPTEKKKKDAREKGQVPESKDLASSFVLLFVFVSINFFSGYIAENFYGIIYYVFDQLDNAANIYKDGNLLPFFLKVVYMGAKILIPILSTALITGVLFAYIQVGALFTVDPLKPKLSKINPIEGFKNLFSIKSLVELGKSIIKSAILIGYTVYYLEKRLYLIVNALELSVIALIGTIWDLIYSIVIRISIMLIITGLIDYIYKRWQHNKDLKMTKKEVEDEHKESEGDPQLKSKIRQKQREMSASRMMQEVPDADVVITNPTHYANALKYDKMESDVPIVVAKGKNLIAKNIKKIAKENDISIVENKPLAQELYKVVDLGDEIPENLYQAVAEILAYVYEVDKK